MILLSNRGKRKMRALGTERLGNETQLNPSFLIYIHV